MRARLYARVSSKEQLEGYSIDAQKRAFNLLCQGRGWEPTGEYIDEGKSAKSDKISKRPAFQKALADVQAHVYDVLVVHKLDRFARNLRISIESLDTLGKAGVTFVSINEQLDLSTAWGKMCFHVLGALAQFYSENLSQETKKGKHERKAQGLYNGLLPFGVMKGIDGLPKPHDETWIIKDKKGNTIEERPPTYAGLLLAFQLAVQGETDKAIARALNTQGYRTHGTHGANPFSKDSVRGILSNRFYIGELPVGRRKEWTKAKHAPLVPLNLFHAALEVRQSKHRLPQTIPGRGHKYSLSGIAKCAHCGSRLRVTDSHNPRMICSKRQDSGDCQAKSARIPYLESGMREYFRSLRVPQEYKDGMLALVKQPVEKDEPTPMN